jgi:omega-amidase
VQDLIIAYLQYNIQWHDWEANVAIIQRHLGKLQRQIDILILPETFSSGFSIDPNPVAQHMNGPVVNWMRETAGSRDHTVMGSVIIEEDGAFYNRLICAYPDGSISHYNKRHLFSLAGENVQFSGGVHRLQFKIRDWTICPLICYDLRFPVWSRNSQEYDVLVYVANWPSPRVEAWQTLLKARAIENQAYTIGVNRTGRDNNDFRYPGSSEVFDMTGQSMHKSTSEDELAVIALNKPKLDSYRSEFNFLADRDSYIVN